MEAPHMLIAVGTCRPCTQVVESIFKLREQQPTAIANEMRNALIDTFA